MKYEDMAKSQRDRVRFSTCTLCHNKFTKLDDVQEIKMRYGRSILHFYFHSNCLLKSRCPSQLEREGVNYAEEG